MAEKTKTENKRRQLPKREIEALKPQKQGGKADHWSLLSEYDIYLFKEGRHYNLYHKMGAHLQEWQGKKGVVFSVWAPNAQFVSVIGDFNGWNREEHPMVVRSDGSGIWEVFIPELAQGEKYKYFIRSQNGYEVEKADPFAYYTEEPPKTASVVWDLHFSWKDGRYKNSRAKSAAKSKPMSVYEVHLASWMRVPEDDNRSLTYREMANTLVKYVKDMNFTHVEFMPVMEHPFGGSWGYQVTGYFAPTSRFGNPQDFMYLVNELHKNNVGVILDWVPSHFPGDVHGLHHFDGSYLFEHSDPRQGFHPDWNSYIFNYGRNEIKSFLISNALFWLEVYHADGLRVDAVASMLYLDYSRKAGEWIPNKHGGNENLEAIEFIQALNEAVLVKHPEALTIAEESTSYPKVSHPIKEGGLGFSMKWMMGWMHDTLAYFARDPVYRRHHQNDITFSLYYAFTEHFMLPLSHDEVVHGKNALVNKMPGDEWQRFANLRLLYALMYAHPGTKLLFMGAEIGQTSEWNHDGSLDWHLLQYDLHKGIQEVVKDLNAVYAAEAPLYDLAFSPEGFQWIDTADSENSVISFLRLDASGNPILVICNFTPQVLQNYRVGVPAAGKYTEIFNSDAAKYGGSNVLNTEPLTADTIEQHGKSHSISLSLPPLGACYFKLRKMPVAKKKQAVKKSA